MVSKQSCTDGSEIDPLRKEAGFVILVPGIVEIGMGKASSSLFVAVQLIFYVRSVL